MHAAGEAGVQVHSKSCMIVSTHSRNYCIYRYKHKRKEQRSLGAYGISLEKAVKACGKVKVLVSIVAASPSIATAPSARG